MDETRVEHCQRIFRSLLWRIQPRRLAEAVEQRVAELSAVAQSEIEWAAALQTVYRRTRDEVVSGLLGAGAASSRH